MSEFQRASCHCKAVQIQIEVPEGVAQLYRCNCSLCTRKGAIMMMVPLAQLKVVAGEDALSLYQWNLRIAKHFFCSVCGIYTHHERRTNPSQCGINVACIEGIDPFSLSGVVLLNGAALSVADDS